jgi:hypothetical protein
MQIELVRTVYEYTCTRDMIWLIDDSPSCKIIVYRCGVIQLGVCILLSSFAQKKTIITLFLDESVFFSSFFFFYRCCSVIWSSLRVSILVCIGLCIMFCCSLHHLYYIVKDYHQATEHIFASFWYRKERTYRERIGKRDIIVNNIDIEEKRRSGGERSQLNIYVHMPVNFFVSLFLSIRFTFTKYTERTKLSVLNEIYVYKIVDHFCCIWISTLTFILLARIDDPLETKLINRKW